MLVRLSWGCPTLRTRTYGGIRKEACKLVCTCWFRFHLLKWSFGTGIAALGAELATGVGIKEQVWLAGGPILLAFVTVALASYIPIVR